MCIQVTCWTDSGSSATGADVLLVVAGMDEVKFQPLVHGERAQPRVIDELHSTKFGAGRDRRGVEPLETATRGVERGVQIELTRGNDMLWRLAPGREIAEPDDHPRRHYLLHRPARRAGRAFLETAL